ncbi:MAG: sulfatase [Candidatus Hydrogenedentota bacterium]
MKKHTPITRRRFLEVTAAAGTVTALAGTARTQDAPRPNILFVCTDQQHGKAWGGADPFFDTPHMDRLADTGTVFDANFCTTPQCSPSRSSIYTGFYPHRTSILGNMKAGTHINTSIQFLPAQFDTIGSRLRAAGYHTGYFGKWHLGNQAHFSTHFHEADLDGEQHAGATDNALRYLAARRGTDQPFALFVNYLDPHDIYHFLRRGTPEDVRVAPTPPTRADDLSKKPWPHKHFMTDDQGTAIHSKPEAYWRHYRWFYREKCRLVDHELGRLLEALAHNGQAENTVVVFTSDHGDMDTNHNLIFKGPFMYEHMVHVPLIVRVPKAYRACSAARTNALTTGVDLMPTLCAFAGAAPGEHHGQSLHSFLTGTGAAPARDYVVSEYYGKQQWISPIRMLRTHEWKYNRYIDHGEELYDLANDPHELHNLAADPGQKARKRELRALLDEWMHAHNDRDYDTYWATDRAGKRLKPVL